MNDIKIWKNIISINLLIFVLFWFVRGILVLLIINFLYIFEVFYIIYENMEIEGFLKLFFWGYLNIKV